MVEAVKWVGEVMTGVPYDLTPDFLNELVTKHRIDYVIHGDDPCLLPDGTDAYAHAKQMGRFKLIKRTEGVSSTDIVGRMLMCTRDNVRFKEDKRRLAKQFSDTHNEYGFNPDADKAESSAERSAARNSALSKFMPTSRRLVQFSDGKAAPADARVVYIDGGFDLFHVGHIELLKKAKELGDFLLVGVHTDEDLRERRGPHLPIMDVHERCLSLLACRHVDDVVIGAPMEITDDLIKTFNISLVVRGTITETSHEGPDEPRRYAVPQQQGIFRNIESPNDMTTATLIHRIIKNRQAYEARNAKKLVSEQKYYQQKQHVREG
jgi:ethanolamine-phosphate cytidylyltransferase